MSLRRVILILFFAAFCTRSNFSRAVSFEFVPVGDAGNPADTRYHPTGFGAVPYSYSISRYEVTNGQYREFLNAKAALGDPYRLYHDQMAIGYGGIIRTGSGIPDDPFVYLSRGEVPNVGRWDDMPVNFVGVWDAARFTNWLNNGQGDADTESGSYTGVGTVYADPVENFRRQPGARYYLPTEDEWYKAAYYDPSKADNGGPYWEYSTRSNFKPSNEAPPGTNFDEGTANFGTLILHEVGSYNAKPSTSFYGTFDQGGNVWEWNETLVIDNYFGLRGGSFYELYGLEAGHRNSYPALFQNAMIGFRVVAVPEPASATLLAIAGMTFLWASKKSRLAKCRAAKEPRRVIDCSREEVIHA